MEVLLGGGGLIGLLMLWKLIEKIVDAKLAKRNNPGKGVICPYENSVALKNSLAAIDGTLGEIDKSLAIMKGTLERISRKLDV